ncbi:hypothetical protein EDD86DRAFT_202830 [Gorgonomyces haynaldii]|nr:hypothetical protein EDD86DRAFT_202830 [Gorgonomyces haynaldii]
MFARLRRFATVQNPVKSLFPKKPDGSKEKLHPAFYFVVGGIGATVIGVDLYHMYLNSLKLDHLTLEFHALPIEKITPITHDTKLYRIKAFGAEHPACSHVIIKDDSCQIARPYTAIVSNQHFFEILVKHYPNGSISQMLSKLNEGDTIQVRGPMPTFVYHPNVAEEVGMVAGGTGIAPMYQLIKRVLHDDQDKTKLTLLYCNKTKEDILLKRELDILAHNHPDRFQVYYALEQHGNDWKGFTGRVTDKMLSVLPSHDKAGVLVCGPDPY